MNFERRRRGKELLIRGRERERSAVEKERTRRGEGEPMPLSINGFFRQLQEWSLPLFHFITNRQQAHSFFLSALQPELADQ